MNTEKRKKKKVKKKRKEKKEEKKEKKGRAHARTHAHTRAHTYAAKPDWKQTHSPIVTHVLNYSFPVSYGYKSFASQSSGDAVLYEGFPVDWLHRAHPSDSARTGPCAARHVLSEVNLFFFSLFFSLHFLFFVLFLFFVFSKQVAFNGHRLPTSCKSTQPTRFCSRVFTLRCG